MLYLNISSNFKKSMLLSLYNPKASPSLAIPLFNCRVSAGFPSPADDYVERKLDLNEHLIKHPSSTFFVKVEGDSMINAGIHSGDLMIVDRSLTAKDGSVIVAVVNGEITVKRFRKTATRVFLQPENIANSVIEILEGTSFEVWGVVTQVIHNL